MKYDHKDIDKKWQKRWQESQLYKSTEKGPKSYVLDMFPYPSGEGLHVGHPKGYIATDVYSRHKRMTGHSVLHPMGWDAFGLPAENYAIKNKVHPRVAVEKNIARFKEQLANIGFDYDWSREINTTDPAYYKWTQWMFIQMFKKGLAFESNEPINWCPSCQTGLANEDVEDGHCERCGTPVIKRSMRQWVLKITDYADRLLEDLNSLPWPEHIKELQRNWIGRSEGTEIDFAIAATGEKITVFTTRPDTLFGATYMVLAPEHPLIHKLESRIENIKDVAAYIKAASQKTEIERTTEGKEKTGIELKGIKAINPATKEEIPVFVADYVLGSYGTGAIMAVPAHDDRDLQFALKFNLQIKPVVAQVSSAKELVPGLSELKTKSICETGMAHVGNGLLFNSASFDGMSNDEAKEKITEKFGRKKVSYKLRDWVFSRQRYWGEPIPLVYCQKDGWVAVPDNELPVRLPEVDHYEPTGTGESPLAAIPEFVNTTCPQCGGPAKRETNTMPQWAGSSWYYLRFMDPHNDVAAVAPDKEKYWAPVDMYVGGAEHATRHLIYARFWHKFLYDIGVVSTTEPFKELHSVGLILAEDGRKMSKRFGNVINPDDVVGEYGADAFRIYEMFMGPFENAIAWSTASIAGARRFIERVCRFAENIGEHQESLDQVLHQTIKKVGDDIEQFKFNTAISQMMIFLNAAEEAGSMGQEQWGAFVRILAPFAPHVAEELWEKLGQSGSVHVAEWPSYDPSKLAEQSAKIVLQINGKVRANIEMPAGASDTELEAAARAELAEKLAGKEVKKAIVVPGRLVNLVVLDK